MDDKEQVDMSKRIVKAAVFTSTLFGIGLCAAMPVHAVGDADHCVPMTEKINALILSDDDSDNDWDVYAANECECEIRMVREKFGDDAATRYARYSELGMQVELKEYASPSMTQEQLGAWIASNHSSFFELMIWADDLLESWSEELGLSVLQDPLEACWD